MYPNHFKITELWELNLTNIIYSSLLSYFRKYQEKDIVKLQGGTG